MWREANGDKQDRFVPMGKPLATVVRTGVSTLMLPRTCGKIHAQEHTHGELV